MSVPDATAVVLIAHGTRRAEGNESHRSLCAELAARTGRTVEPAFLELADPDLVTAVGRVVAAGATRVVVLPHFLHPGNHTARDIPALVADAASRHPGVEVTVQDHTGADPAMVDLLAARIDP